MAQDYKYDEKTGSYVPIDDHHTGGISDDDRIIAILFWAIQFLSSLLFPLVITIIGYVYYKDKDNKFLAATAKETLNFQITFMLFALFTVLIGIFTLGIGLVIAIPIISIYNIGIPILGILKSLDRKVYKPHFTFRIIE